MLISVAALMTAWRACRTRPLGIGDFRTWLACHELQARRCALQDDRAPIYSSTELARLLDVTEKRARASVNRLVVAGLLTWSDSAIEFLDPRIDLAGLDDTIGRGQGSLAIPRRMLRFLAHGARPALIATVLGILLRCLSRRKAGFDGRGRVKASWIARVFGVDLRQGQGGTPGAGRAGMDRARAGSTLGHQSLGGLLPDRPGLGSAQARWLEFATSSPRRWSRFATSCIRPGTPSGENSKPGTRRGADWFFNQRLGRRKQDPPGPDPRRRADRGPEGHRPAARPAPPGHRRKLVGSSEADRLKFFAAAEHALAIGKGNPPGLFAWLVRNGCWRYLTSADEDAARRRLKLHDFGPPRGQTPSALPSFSPSKPIDPGLADDARIVKVIREAAIKAGLFRDPFPAFQARYGWSRERWDAALDELGLR